MADRVTGKVVWWNKAKGYGFVRDDFLTSDYFAHYKDVEFKGKRKFLREGKVVSFVMDETSKGSRAREIREE